MHRQRKGVHPKSNLQTLNQGHKIQNPHNKHNIHQQNNTSKMTNDHKKIKMQNYYIYIPTVELTVGLGLGATKWFRRICFLRWRTNRGGAWLGKAVRRRRIYFRSRERRGASFCFKERRTELRNGERETVVGDEERRWRWWPRNDRGGDFVWVNREQGEEQGERARCLW